MIKCINTTQRGESDLSGKGMLDPLEILSSLVVLLRTA